MRPPCYLVRHGQSEWNLAELTQGQAVAPPLTATGRRQARAAAVSLAADLAADLAGVPDDGADVGPVRLLTSDLVRARQTADEIALRLGVRPVLEPRLREQHLGTLEGRPYADSWAYAEGHDWSDPDLPVAGGESPRQLRDRMAAVLDDVAHHDSRDRAATVLVSHGDAIRAALAHLVGVAMTQADWVEVPNGAVARIDGRAVRWLG